jgi:hypothetical protein
MGVPLAAEPLMQAVGRIERYKAFGRELALEVEGGLGVERADERQLVALGVECCELLLHPQEELMAGELVAQEFMQLGGVGDARPMRVKLAQGGVATALGGEDLALVAGDVDGDDVDLVAPFLLAPLPAILGEPQRGHRVDDIGGDVHHRSDRREDPLRHGMAKIALHPSSVPVARQQSSVATAVRPLRRCLGNARDTRHCPVRRLHQPEPAGIRIRSARCFYQPMSLPDFQAGPCSQHRRNSGLSLAGKGGTIRRRLACMMTAAAELPLGAPRRSEGLFRRSWRDTDAPLGSSDRSPARANTFEPLPIVAVYFLLLTPFNLDHATLLCAQTDWTAKHLHLPEAKRFLDVRIIEFWVHELSIFHFRLVKICSA